MFYSYFLTLSGTGSYLETLKGLQRKILLIPNKVPYRGPNLSMASNIYSEHVGWNRQLGGRSGEMYVL